MVNYKGEAIVANSTQNQDLLWASCGGGGGNFGKRPILRYPVDAY